MTETRLTVRHATSDAGSLLRLSGELDAHTADQLAGELASLPANEGDTVILDMTDLRFVDSVGLRAVIAEHKRQSDVGGHLRLQGLNDRVARVFEYAGLNDHLEISSEA
jgi:anti-sigma B factor antagonist